MCLVSLFLNYRKYIKNLTWVGVVFVLMGCNNSSVVLVKEINQSAAQEITVLLGVNDVDSTEQIDKNGLYSIFVTQDKKLVALQLLQNSGLPSPAFTNLGEIFKKDSFISSPLEEHGRFIYALNQQISDMLSSLNGVVSVKTAVSIATPTDSLWQYEMPKPSASVLIKYQPGARVDLYINKIKAMVSNAVPGLTPERVEVVTITQKML